MRPYLALIKDSFRAAIASNVLYVLLGVITLLLLVIAPLHVRESLDWRIRFGGNVTKVDELCEKLVQQGEDEDQPAVQRVWDRLDSTLQENLKQLVDEQAQSADSAMDPGEANSKFMKHMRIKGDLEDALNEIVKGREFYDEDAWSNKRLNPEARELIDEGTAGLSDERSRRLNRLLMASAFPGIIQRGSGNALNLWYGPWQWEGMSFAISFNDFANATLQTVTYLFDKFVLSIGLLIAILVTANFIPETFLPGSLNLLLSKPISRWGLLVAKFAGGCAFVTLCAAYLFIGLWLWLGFGMGIWDRGILWGIPLYIVVFAIYYSVSTFVGVYSRSPILSIIVTGLFWAACFLVGLTYQMFEGRIDNSRTRGLVAVKDQILHIGELNAVSTWDNSSREWEKVLEIKMMEEQRIAMGAIMFVPGAGDDGDLNTVGPVYDPKFDEVISGVLNLGNPTAPKELFVADVSSMKFQEVGKMPRDAIKAVSARQGVIVFSRDGQFWRYAGSEKPTADKKSDSKAKDQSSASDADNADKTKSEVSQLGKLANSLFNQKKKKKADVFKRIGPDDRVTISSGQSVAFNFESEQVFVVTSDDELVVFEAGDEKYSKISATKIENCRKAMIESAGRFLVMVFPNGQIQLRDATTLEEVNSFKPQEKSPYRSVISTPDGKYFAFRCRDKTLWLLDTEKPNTVSQANIYGQGSITAAAFDDQNQLWYSTRHNRVHQVDLESSKNLETYAPATGWLAKAFDYGINPMYWIFPKPGEFYKLVAHLSANPEDEETEVDLSGLSDAPDPWQPLWSGLLFMCGMLFVTGLIFHFRDF